MPKGFPDDFWWGTGASSNQCEGAAPASDWLRWEHEGKAPPSGQGSGFAQRYAEDFSLYAGLGLTHHRLSIEWARIEPAEGKRDRAEVERYQDIARAARDAGINLWVCLHHFTLPAWFVDDHGGMVDAKARDRYWRRHVEFMAETFGDVVFGWKPINEPMAFAYCGWLGGIHPPGRKDMAEYLTALRASHLSNYAAAAILRQTGKVVASVHNLNPTYPADDRLETAVLLDALDDVTFRCWIGAERDGVLRVPGTDPVEDPAFTEAFDMVGFSYYGTSTRNAESRVGPYPPGTPLGPIGYSPSSEGIKVVLDRLHAELPGKPLLVSEHGVGTTDDAVRCAIVERSLGLVRDAIAEDVPVKGFFHWTGVDNYEWTHGYDLPFGLFDRDRNPRPSADLMASYAGGNQSSRIELELPVQQQGDSHGPA